MDLYMCVHAMARAPFLDFKRDGSTVPSSLEFSKGARKMEVARELWESTTEIAEISVSDRRVYDLRGFKH
jgi:hypothetical protein